MVKTIVLTEIIARNIKNVILFYYYNHQNNYKVDDLENEVESFIQLLICRKDTNSKIFPLFE
jgi:hypothetical protein